MTGYFVTLGVALLILGVLFALKNHPARWLDGPARDLSHGQRPSRRAKPPTGALPRTGGRFHRKETT